MLGENKLVKIIQEFGCKYKIHKHAPLHTVQDSVKLRGKIEGLHSKNLFLKNKKNQFYLFSCLENTRVDLKKISKTLNAGNISFAKEIFPALRAIETFLRSIRVSSRQENKKN